MIIGGGAGVAGEVGGEWGRRGVWGAGSPTGLFFKPNARLTLEEQEPVLDEGGPLAHRELGLSQEETERIVSRMM